MVKLACLYRIKDKKEPKAPYVAFMMQDEFGLELKVNRQSLISAINNGQVEVNNLRVSADNTNLATIGVVDKRIMPKAYRRDIGDLIATKGPVAAYVYDQACVIYKFLGGNNYRDITLTVEKDKSQVRFKINYAIFYQDKMWFIEGLTCFNGHMMTSTLYLNNALGESCDIRMSELMTNDGFTADMAQKMNQVGYKFINDLSKVLKYSIIPLSGAAFGQVAQVIGNYKLGKPLRDYTNNRIRAGLSS